MIDAMWDAFVELDNQVQAELLDATEGSAEERRGVILSEKLATLSQVLGRVEDVLSEPKEPVVEPESRRVRMWVDDLSGLNRKLNSAHGVRVTLDEVVEHLKQWDK